MTLFCMMVLKSPNRDAPRNPKNAAVDRKCSGEPAMDSVMVSAQVRPA